MCVFMCEELLTLRGHRQGHGSQLFISHLKNNYKACVCLDHWFPNSGFNHNLPEHWLK